MRNWVSLAAIVVALASPTTALAQGPPEVYSDFAQDGELSCGHSRSALKATLNDASIHQYGDPYTFIGLKLAVRKQLAGGCRRRAERVSQSARSGDSPSANNSSKPGSTKATRKTGSRPTTTEDESIASPTTAGVPTDGRRDGRMVLLAVGLLLLTLGSGGWAARRAFTD